MHVNWSSVCALLFLAAAAGAQQPLVYSMGQPPVWQLYGGAALAQGNAGLLSGGVYRSLTNPVTGMFGMAAEGYGSIRSSIDPGLRLLASTRALGLSAGVDWNAGTGDVDVVASFQTAIRRGGLLGHGTMLRLDWLPSRNNAIAVGIQAPLLQPLAGRTRSRATEARLPALAAGAPLIVGTLPADAENALATVAEAATVIRAYTNLYSAENERALLATVQAYRAPRTTRGLQYGQNFTAAARAYDEALAQAFGVAAGNPAAGDAIARRARAGVLDRVILPYDSLFGRVKPHGNGIRDFTSAEHGRFVAWVRDSSGIGEASRTAVASVHARWLDIIEGVHRALVSQWDDSRLVWLPLQLALAAEQYDEQAEVDALLARVIGRPFTDGNALTYLRSTDLPLEIARSIFATRDYHVLWTHDFTGRRETGAIDEIGYSMVADVYLPALTQAVTRYDSVGKLPVYMILLDQFFYEPRDGRAWMTILEDPLNARLRLSGDDGTHEAHLAQRQAELRAAVAASRRLQRDAAAGGGDGWLRKVIKVHVNIVHPSDFSFRSNHILPYVPFAPDNIMRDHRKVVFYDITEADSYKGALIVTGVGIGEHYASATWEDRGYRVRGPAALEVRAAARRALALNGFRDGDIPVPLRAVESARATEQQANRGDYVGRALQVHNEVGFGAKESSVARAMLYNLAPPGSVIIVPDPLWVSPSWGAMLVGAAARGSRVFVISPALANGPNPQPPVADAQHDVMKRLLEIRDRLGEQFKQAGGEIRVGLFTGAAPVNDVAGRAREVQEGLARAPWIRELIPFDASTLAVLERVTVQTAADGRDATAIAHDAKPRAPQLHQKTQLIARPGAIGALVRQPGWDVVLAQTMRVQSQQTTKFADQLGYMTPDVDSTALRSADQLLQGFERARSDADRKAMSFYFSLGTQNQDPRGLMMDGEASVVVSGFHAAAGLVDLYFMMARTTWIETKPELDRLLPQPKGLLVKLARLFRLAL